MNRRRQWQDRLERVVAGALVGLALFTGTAHAKPWARWAPAPLASDSSYAALSALPADSLGTAEFAWMQVQRDWRAQRGGEESGAGRGIAASEAEHVPRAEDPQFAKLASRPFAELGESERAWLVTESAAQRAARAKASGSFARFLVFGLLSVTGLAVFALWGVSQSGWLH